MIGDDREQRADRWKENERRCSRLSKVNLNKHKQSKKR